MARQTNGVRARADRPVTIHDFNKATLFRWAKAAGYKTRQRHAEFRERLKQEILWFNFFLSDIKDDNSGEIRAADVRKQMAPVAKAAGQLLAALAGMDTGVARCFSARLEPRDKTRGWRQAIGALRVLLRHVRRESDKLSKADADAMPTPVTEKGGRMGNIEDLAKGLVEIYECGGKKFEMKGTPGRRSGSRYAMDDPNYPAFPWFAEILSAIARLRPEVDQNVIDEAAEEGRAAVNLDRARARLLGILRTRAAAN